MKSLLFLLSLLLFATTHSFSQNQRPVAVNDTVDGMLGYTLRVNFLGNDYDPDGDSIYMWHAPFKKLNDSTWEYTMHVSEYQTYRTIKTYDYSIRDSQGNFGFGKLVVRLKGVAQYDFLDINNIKALISPFGNHFYDLEQAQFEVPKGSGKKSMFAHSQWIAGYDDSLRKHFAVERYRQDGFDYCTGPISDVYDSLYNIKWNRIWKISRKQIQDHIANWASPGYQTAEVISNWPAHGDIEKGQAANIAPFYDSDGNDHYEPMKGDYPLIRGDQAVFLIINDIRYPHLLSNTWPLGVEIHEMAYAFDKPEDSTLNNTIFIHSDILNRGSTTYNETYIGFYNDFDLGNAIDDYIGTDVTNGIFYGYNGTAIDGNPDSSYAYGEHPPALGLKIIGGPYLEPDGMDNPTGYCDAGINGINFGDGIIDNERVGLMHTTSFRYMNPCPSYGDPIFNPYCELSCPTWFGSTGEINLCDSTLPSGTGPFSNFVFPGNSDTLCFSGTNGQRPLGGYYFDEKYWTEKTVENQPGDRRGFASMGPFTLQPGQVVPLDYCFTWARDYEGDNLSSVELLRERIAMMKPYWNSLIKLPENLYDPEGDPVKELLQVYPNPSRNFVKVFSTLDESSPFFIFDLSGKPVKSGVLQRGENTLDISHLVAGIYFIKCGTQVARIEKI